MKWKTAADYAIPSLAITYGGVNITSLAIAPFIPWLTVKLPETTGEAVSAIFINVALIVAGLVLIYFRRVYRNTGIDNMIDP